MRKSYEKFFISIVLISIFSFTFVAIYEIVHANLLRLHPQLITEEGYSTREGYLVDTPGCLIPEIDPFDPEIRSLFKYNDKLKCPDVPLVAFSNRTHLTVDLTIAKKHYGENVTCVYKSVRRKGEGKTDSEYQIDDKNESISGSQPISDEFVTVQCVDGNQTIKYQDFFPFIHLKKEVEERCGHQSVNQSKQQVLSVTLLGIDSVSRLNMIRQMPKTYNHLKNVMKAIELQGFTKVADNTFVNMVPLLSGLFADECWNETLKESPLDYLNLIWKNFSARGFRTLIAEDMPQIAGFNYCKRGFFHQPSDYYFRPFTLAAKANLDIEKNCYNSRLEVKIVLQWLFDYLHIFKTKPTFAYVFNSRITHDDVNDAGYTDEPYHKFLNYFYLNNLHNNSILFFFSDHGMRFGSVRHLYIGKIEERMPFFFLIFPPWFQHKYPKIWKNLKINQNRLTTHFDIYETLKDLLNFTGEDRKANLTNRGISLFSEIPPERTCKHAAIVPHWCVCNQRVSVNISNDNVIAAANKIIDAINKEVSGEGQCAKLSLERIIDARVSGLSDDILNFHYDVSNLTLEKEDRVNGVANYLITVAVKPSEGIFEGTVEYFESSGLFVVSGDISRINSYGNQSECIENYKLRKFCYCI